ncbi:amino acid ABC transporter permease [Streptomyces sp. TRM68367]|uniref:amino acid ABC transporter permease n=1 Tax=Streptomyces sp. TRM68367 TaxID=2758415 RepID=UPI00165CC582|nr:amino acid ABC transporter permease [Streptomyces sp. TRM68367]MBC9730476.1 amino acid ABC transporter permease [Streptomyces sp. TRM68367]
MSFLTDWTDAFPQLWDGIKISAQLVAGSLALGMPLGLLLALGSASRVVPVRYVVIALVEIGRGTPALVMLQIVYFGLPEQGLSLSNVVSATLALALTTGAYASEIIRGGLQSVPQGQLEAADALGMSRLSVLRFIVIPQGLRVAIPALMGLSILIFQATSLAYSIAVPELLAAAYSYGSSTFKYLSVLSLAGLMYLSITIPASWLSERVERRLARHV